MLYAMVIFLLYVSFIIVRYNGLNSISESYYRLGRYGYIFCIWLSLVSLMVMYFNMDKPLIMLAGGFLFYVPVAATYKEDIGGVVHYVGAVGSIVLGLLWMLLNDFVHVAIIQVYLVIVIYAFFSKPILWIEIISFILIALCLL